MELIEKFAGAGSFYSSFVTGAGDDVGLTLEDMTLYTILPFGQLFMRMFKFGGSLDKPYLLFLMFPSFGLLVNVLNPFDSEFKHNMMKWGILSLLTGWIAPLFGYAKLLKKVDNSNNMDAIMLLPIFFRFIIVATLLYIDFDDYYRPLVIHFALFFIMMLTNFIHLAIRPQCNSGNSKNSGNRFWKILVDTVLQYGIIFFFIGMIAKTRNYAEDLYSKPIPLMNNIGELIQSIIWCIGASFAYTMTNMIDSNYNTDNTPPHKNDDVCKGETSQLRSTISFIVLITGLLYNLWVNRFF